MKQLTDTERLEVAMSLLDERQVDEYATICTALEQDEEQARSTADVVVIQRPAECEHFGCSTCTMVAHSRKEIDCPYVDDEN